ncbi:MAG: electron transfer flavoprotein subunit beta/FixA family protein [Thaumarchaeota archaeon]|nr:electron transfer flavoprotein subunit beta/FixA family protein [Nitrososphaerota archaeon]
MSGKAPLRIIVCLKHAVDESELRVDASGHPILQGAQARMSAFDRNAVEEGVSIKEKAGGTVTALSLGTEDVRKSIKEALAMGCDRAILVNSSKYLDALATSYYLARAVQRAAPYDLMICSEGASDTYDGLVGPMLAQWLDLPFMGYVRRTELRGDGSLQCELAMEESVEVVEARFPSVISVVSEINSPRYPTLLQIMQASKKPIEEFPLDSLAPGPGEAAAPEAAVRVLDTTAQSMSRKKILFEGSPEESASKLLEALKSEGVL